MSKENININIGNKLRERRIALGLSQAAIADRVGIASQQVQKYEKGINSMNAERIHEFAQILKVPISYFFEDIEKGKNLKTKSGYSFAEDSIKYESGFNGVSDRETLEVLKSFKRIKDHAVRKRISDLLRSVSMKDI